MKKNRAFEMAPISDNFFVSAYNRVRCSATFGKLNGNDEGQPDKRKKMNGFSLHDTNR